MHASEASAIGS